jgi:phage FluMu protein Com
VSHPAAWRCTACPAILGHVRAGVLTVLVPRPAVGGGKVAVVCPECSTIRVWTIEAPCPTIRKSG